MTQSMETHGRETQVNGHPEGDSFDPADHRPTRRGLRRLGTGAVLVLAALVAAGLVPRAVRRAVAEKEAKAAASVVPTVEVARARKEASTGPVVLPGTVQPLKETAIYARANGYVRSWKVDIGAEVKKGDVLAELDLPDVDQELRQAEATARQVAATIPQAMSQLDFARTTTDRFSALAVSGVVSKQQNDQYASDYEVRRANLDAARAATGSANANVRRVEELRGFGTLVAPFDGVVTLRAAEVGQLVVSGTGQGQPLFKIAEDDVVRIFVNVPQLYAAGVKVGSDAPVTVREAAGRAFKGNVARTSRQLDTASRALLVEVDVPNPDRALVSGMYAKVSLDVSRQDAPLMVPATAALVDASGMRVALVQDGRIHWQTVEIAGDMGDRLIIAGGLADGDVVVVTPSERLTEGLSVQPHGAT